ncbi:MAG: PTS sugar transporter [Thermodesulfobacteriota bacterium]|nr:MAG: PTS sugar transporter [Thermodesulfobacteriota bacterium]
MVGAVVITHGNIGEAVVEAVKSITGKVDKVRVISVREQDGVDALREKLLKAVRDVDGVKGVLVFTDMFGGTPTNIALSVLEEDRVEVLAGMNLPVMLKFENYRKEKPLSELALYLKEYGQSSIVLAGNVLKEKKQ